jgi:hypothetical protein
MPAKFTARNINKSGSKLTFDFMLRSTVLQKRLRFFGRCKFITCGFIVDLKDNYQEICAIEIFNASKLGKANTVVISNFLKWK